MKSDIHPTYHKQAVIQCACGNTITTGSTTEETEVEVCANCHPFYTGREKLVDTAGRVERFEAMMEKSKKLKKETPAADADEPEENETEENETEENNGDTEETEEADA